MCKLNELVSNFVNGFVAGSCNSIDECIYRLVELLKENNFELSEDEIIKLFDAEVEKSGIFLCDECGWWCWDHDLTEYSICADCVGEE